MRWPSFSVSTNTPSQSNKRALGRTDGAAEAMHFTTPNPFPLLKGLFLIFMLANLEPPSILEHDDDDDKRTVFLAKNWVFAAAADDDKRTVFLAKNWVFADEDEAVSGG